jgi:hypothetical protein
VTLDVKDDGRLGSGILCTKASHPLSWQEGDGSICDIPNEAISLPNARFPRETDMPKHQPPTFGGFPTRIIGNSLGQCLGALSAALYGSPPPRRYPILQAPS